ncbi:unnamed protein product [Cuscuta epithymum]|uniref:Uncharacterized protein n=1 Tax=Cuscuta epithymum TaxID=186058 RepID=A0AAV0DRP9_9ASTE|nr:unnamed protein product [Cuscuta epithymum]
MLVGGPGRIARRQGCSGRALLGDTENLERQQLLLRHLVRRQLRPEHKQSRRHHSPGRIRGQDLGQGRPDRVHEGLDLSFRLQARRPQHAHSGGLEGRFRRDSVVHLRTPQPPDSRPRREPNHRADPGEHRAAEPADRSQPRRQPNLRQHTAVHRQPREPKAPGPQRQQALRRNPRGFRETPNVEPGVAQQKPAHRFNPGRVDREPPPTRGSGSIDEPNIRSNPG